MKCFLMKNILCTECIVFGLLRDESTQQNKSDVDYLQCMRYTLRFVNKVFCNLNGASYFK